MLRWRLLLGTAFIGMMILLCWADAALFFPGMFLLPLAIFLGGLATGEYLWLVRDRAALPDERLLYAGNGLIILGSAIPLWMTDCPLGSFGWTTTLLALSLLAALTLEIGRFRGPGHAIERLAMTTFGLLYIGILFSFFIHLRLLSAGASTGMGNGTLGSIDPALTKPGSLGIMALGSLIIVVKMCDTGAYTVGRLIGRHKMSPHVSPGKTWEGFGGGLVFAFIGAWFTFHVLLPWVLPSLPAVSWLQILVFAVAVGMAGVIGDLAESLIKREVGRKDSSSWLPGFGGVLDILDSLLGGAPVAYLWWQWYLG